MNVQSSAAITGYIPWICEQSILRQNKNIKDETGEGDGGYHYCQLWEDRFRGRSFQRVMPTNFSKSTLGAFFFSKTRNIYNIVYYLDIGDWEVTWINCTMFVRFFVDDIPIRVFKNCKDLGVRFPFNQPMKIYSSLWNADDWATRGGLEKTDWSKAPFIATYRGFHIDGCEASVEAKFCATQGKRWWDQKEFQDLDSYQYRRLQWVRTKYTIYNYCTDRVRYPTLSPECKRDRDI
jgi:hypothetical protein